jgi:predicted nucleotidyltransferase
MSGIARLDGLPSNVSSALSTFLAAARDALSGDLVSAVLFGSAAEGRLGPSSDTNLLLVLRTFTPEKIVRLRDAFLAAEAAIKLRAMFVLEDELRSAAELFAQKFADILRRHRLVFGQDVLAILKIPREAEVFRLRQILLNLVVRLRESCIGRGHRPEQARFILADVLGPFRAACGTLLELEGAPIADSNAALAAVATSLSSESGGVAARLVAVHDSGALNIDASELMFQALALVMQVYGRAARLT